MKGFGEMREYFIPACSGASMDIAEGQTNSVIDVEGGQVADFFAEYAGNPHEFLSSAVTIDCNESLKLHVGDYIYTNFYRPSTHNNTMLLPPWHFPGNLSI